MWVKCLRTDKVTKPGKYTLQKLPEVTNDPVTGKPDGASHVIYVCEDFAREMYRGLEDHNKTPKELVQLDMIPLADYDTCSYFEFEDENGDEYEDGPKEIPFMSDKIRNARDLLNA